MNKAVSFAFVLLTLSVAQSQYVEKNFYKDFVTVYSRDKGGLIGLDQSVNLQTTGSGELSLSTSTLGASNPQHFWYRKIDSNDLSVISTSSFSYSASGDALVYGGYVIDFTYETDQDNKTMIKVTQFNFEQNRSLPSFTISVDDAYVEGIHLSSHVEDNDVHVCYPGLQTMTLVRFQVGEVNLKETVVIPVQARSAVIGMAKVSSNQLLVTMSTYDTTSAANSHQEILVDLEHNDFKVNQVSGFTSFMSCEPYVTKKYYGSVCQDIQNRVYITRNSSQELENLFNGNEYPISVNTFSDYLVTISFQDEKGVFQWSYELWDLETLSSVKGKVVFLINTGSLISFYQSDNGSLYAMSVLYETKHMQPMRPIKEIKVGILLSSDSIEEQDTTSEDDKLLIQNFLA